ncbi:hypothetical protein F3C84_27125 [Bacteroides ovatus]|nr:hypothetical protein F3C84_27125 [Bacteroides ovatus]
MKEGQKVNEEKQIRYSKYLVISFALIAVLIIFFKLFCGGTSGNNNDVQGTVQRIADDNKQTGKSVDRAIEHVGTATDELGRADEANRRAAFILSEDKDRINTCAEIINRLQRNNSRAKQILADVERANQEAE